MNNKKWWRISHWVNSDKDYYFIAHHDEIIEPIVDYSWKNLKVYENESVKHRFNGPEFNDVIELIKKL